MTHGYVDVFIQNSKYCLNPKLQFPMTPKSAPALKLWTNDEQTLCVTAGTHINADDAASITKPRITNADALVTNLC